MSRRVYVIVKARPPLGRLVVSTAIQLALAAFWALVALGAATSPAGPVWLIWLGALAALVFVAGAALAVTAWLMDAPEQPDIRLRPVRHAERYAADPRDWQTLTWHAHSPDRPSAQRPSPGLTWHCPVVPGKPRTVRDLHRKPPRDLHTWE